MKTAPLAKITRPKLSGIVKRERLFHLLDQGKQKPVVWVAAQAGSGKTTLVASWLDSRKLPCLWYQIDEGDADIGSFFYYMGMAAKNAAPRYKKSLPLLTPEYLQGIPVFTRRYFEELFSRIKSPSVVVLDNYQDAPLASSFHDMLAHGLDTIPEGITVVIQSRSAPPPQLSRLQANNKLHTIGWDDVCFTREESLALLDTQGHGKQSPETLNMLHDKTEGWAAGLILLAGSGTAASASKPLADMSANNLFDYFDSEIFRKSDTSIQDFLLKTSFLQKIYPAMAEKLAGNAMAGQILERMSRDHYFTQKYGQAYQYHPLFREFLLMHAHNTFSLDELSRIKRHAATLFAESGQIEDAALLFYEAREWEEFAGLILSQAQALVTQGRSKTLEEWISGIPKEFVGESPWLLYWLGRCRMLFNPYEGRDYLIRAFDMFKECKNLTGLLLSWAFIVDTILYGWGEKRERWIREFDEILAAHAALPSPDLEVRTTVSMFCLLMLWTTHRHDLAAWEKKVMALAYNCPNPRLKMQMHHLLVIYHLWIGDFTKVGALLGSLQKPDSVAEDDPLPHLLWYDMNAQYAWVAADHERCFDAVRKGLQLAEKTGVHFIDAYLLKYGISAAVSLGYPEFAEEWLRMMSSKPLDNPMTKSFYHYLSSLAAWKSGKIASSDEDGKIALGIVGDLDYRVGPFCCHVMRALTCHDGGQHNDAEHHLVKMREIAAGANYLEYITLLISAGFSLNREQECIAMLRRAMELGARQGYMNFAWWQPAVMSRLCAKALEYGIEVGYVQELIKKRALVPHDGAKENWPYPIKIYTLRKFEIVKDGKLLEFSGKVQKKPLELLKLLIDCGGQTTEGYISDALWPEAGGDMAHNSFKMAVSRLRNLIGKESIKYQDGKISLNPNCCWVDTLAVSPVKS